MQSILLAGATGLVGRAVLETFEARKEDRKMTVLVRRHVPDFDQKRNCHQQVIDFKAIGDAKDHIRGDIFICTLGTTIKKAGSKKHFFAVDCGYPLSLAQMAFENGSRQMILVSSVGANAAAANHYLRTKGELEVRLAEIGFAGLHILRPSLLLGKRDEFRPGEEIAKKFARVAAFLMPAKYKPVSARRLARKIYAIAEQSASGVHIYEGKKLY